MTSQSRLIHRRFADLKSDQLATDFEKIFLITFRKPFKRLHKKCRILTHSGVSVLIGRLLYQSPNKHTSLVSSKNSFRTSKKRRIFRQTLPPVHVDSRKSFSYLESQFPFPVRLLTRSPLLKREKNPSLPGQKSMEIPEIPENP